ncbi:MAG: hypothetical protein JWM58_1929 [Rhizobium sp.]|nr:hypothetical protein [Rhizobium sp.]
MKTPAITLERIEAAMEKLLDIIEHVPEAEPCWPIYERLEREREAFISGGSRVAAARQRLRQARLDQNPT